MSSFVCTVLTARGERYAIFESIIGQFICPPSNQDECTERVGNSNDGKVFDLRPEILAQAASCIDKLEAGKSLSVNEAVVLDNFVNFLSATIAPHQYDYPELKDKVVGGWVDELGLREVCSNLDDWWEIVNEQAMWPAFQAIALNERCHVREDIALPTEAQNKLAGRYVKTLATVANLIGENPATPEEVMLKFYEMSLTREQGT